MTHPFDSVGAGLIEAFYASGAHLRPSEAELAALVERGNTGEVGGLVGQMGGEHPKPRALAWKLDSEGRRPTAHEKLARERDIAEPQGILDTLHTHLLATCPLAVLNGFDLDWVVCNGRADAYKGRFHTRQRMLMDHNPAVVAEHCGRVFGLLSALPYGTRTFSVEPGRMVGTTTVVAASPVDAAKFFVVMKTLDVLRTRPVEPPAWVVEKHSKTDMAEDVEGFLAGIPDLRITYNR